MLWIEPTGDVHDVRTVLGAASSQLLAGQPIELILIQQSSMRAGRQKLIDLVLLQLPPPAESGRPACICVIVLVPEILHPRSAILKAESLMGERQSVIDDRDNCPPRRTSWQATAARSVQSSRTDSSSAFQARSRLIEDSRGANCLASPRDTLPETNAERASRLAIAIQHVRSAPLSEGGAP